jgi:large subunit GTPase 1
MPTFVATKAHMVVSGILPIDQMRDYVPPVSLVSFVIDWWVNFLEVDIR